MCLQWYFYQANEKQTRTTLKNINFVLLRGRKGGWGRLFQILSLWQGVNSKRGAYFKLGANSSTVRPLLSGHPRDFNNWPLAV